MMPTITNDTLDVAPEFEPQRFTVRNWREDADFEKMSPVLIASRNATADDFRRSIALIESGRADVAAWITDRVPLAEVPYALPRWAAPGSDTIKAIVEV